MKKRFTKNQILTIPNAMSLFRLLLIPLFVWLYCVKDAHYKAVAVIGISILTDVFDGMIARKFNMTSDVGKVLDPIADKLTQAAMIVILYTRYREIIILLLLIALREIALLILGAVVLKRTDTVNSSQWYGKAATVAVEGTMVVLLLFEDITTDAAGAMLTVCCAFVAFALFGYARMYFSILRRSDGGDDADLLSGFGTAEDIALLVLTIIIFLALRFREAVTAQAILSFSPKSTVLAVAVMLLIYAFKSVTFVIYLGILFAADGLLFPTPLALAVGLAGTAVAATIPFFIGRRLGAERVDRLVEKNKKMALVRKFRSDNDFFFVLITRLAGLPSDLLSFYMGAASVPYSKYLLASVLGFLPELVIYTVIGGSMDDPSSSEFKIAVAAEAAVIIGTAVGYYIYKRCRKGRG